MCKDCKEPDAKEQILPIRPTDKMGVPQMRELVGVAIGAASMAWEEGTKGQFLSEYASSLVDDLCRAIEQHVDNQLLERKREWEEKMNRSIQAAQGQAKPTNREGSR